MKVQYQIFEVDENHLKENDSLMGGRKKRVCFVEATFKTYVFATLDSFEEAVETIKDHGKDFTEYTIIPRIYKTNYDD